MAEEPEWFESYQTQELKKLYEALLKNEVPPGTPVSKMRAMARFIRLFPPPQSVFSEKRKSARALDLRGDASPINPIKTNENNKKDTNNRPYMKEPVEKIVKNE